VKSVQVQQDLALQFVAAKGWTAGPVFTDTMTGAVFTQRPGLQALLAALQQRPAPFQHLVIETQDRLGRETVDLLPLVRQIEQAGVTIWGVSNGKQVSMATDDRILNILRAEMDTMERKKVAPKVRSRAHQRHANGFVVGGKVYGYTNKRTCGGCIKDGVGTCRHPSVRLINDEQAAVVRRIFTLTAEGAGLAKIRTILNREGVAGPRGAWAITGVREVLHRRDYVGDIITNRIQRARDAEGNPIRIEQPESAWKIRKDETLRIVSDEQWHAAHARVERTKKSYLRRGHRLVGQVESTKGLYLLSGFLSCGVCHKPLIASRRGRNQVLTYACREHRERGDAACTNTTGVPAAELHTAVITSLRETFTEQTFVEHLEKQAANVEAKAQRAAERTRLIAELPRLAAEEKRLVKRIASVEDDGLVAALKDEWAEAKRARETAERRLADLEGIERDLAADQAEVESLLQTWKGWSEVLAQVQGTPDGSVPAEAQAQARQVLKKVLVGTIRVKPNEPGDWSFAGYTRFEGLVVAGVKHGTVVTYTWPTESGYFDPLNTPIAGGSDSDLSGVSAVHSTDMAPHAPQLAPTVPAKPWLRAPWRPALLRESPGAGAGGRLARADQRDGAGDRQQRAEGRGDDHERQRGGAERRRHDRRHHGQDQSDHDPEDDDQQRLA
jgi:DNA invertase Pin-like site-specific DNA recombinase